MKISDIADCEKYFRTKVPPINRQNLRTLSLKYFYRWLGFAMTANNALRPSSIANMKYAEYVEAYERGNTKVVVVSGNL